MSELELESDVWLSQKGEIMGTFVALRMLQTIVNKEMNGSFPNVYICLRIYLPLLVKNCSRGRSLSALNVYITKGERKSRRERSSLRGAHRSSKPRALPWVNTALYPALSSCFRLQACSNAISLVTRISSLGCCTVSYSIDRPNFRNVLV